MKNLLLIILISLSSCQKKVEIPQEEISPMNQIATGKEFDSLYNAASKKGDCDAFFELYKDMMEYQDKTPILKFAKETTSLNPYCDIAQSAYFNALCRKYDIRDYYEYTGRDIRKMNKSDYDEAIKCLKSMLKNEAITKSEFDAVIK